MLPGRSGIGRLLARDPQALAPFPQAFAADSQLVGQFGFGHVFLMLKNEMLEVIFQRQIFGRLIAHAVRVLHGFQRIGCLGGAFMLKIQFNTQQIWRNSIFVTKNGRSLYGVFQLPHVAWPGMQADGIHRVLGKVHALLVHLAARAGQQCLGDQHDVFATLA